MLNIIIVIPARWSSSRLPGKPIIKLKGVPMIVRTYKQCKKVMPKRKIYVATDDYRIKKVCNSYDIQTVMTSKKCLTGTDRIAELAKKIKADVYINIQGDEPICSVKDIKKLIHYSRKFPKDVINGYAKIKSKKLFLSPHIPKVVFRNDGRLLFQSRAPIPTTKKFEFIKAWRQICIYSLPYKALKAFASVRKKTTLENIEDCELNRFLELGYEVRMIKMTDKSISVDQKSDIKKVEKYLK